MEEGEDELSDVDSRRVRRLVKETLEINDSPSSRIPGEIADYIYWNCDSLSRDAVERWLNSLTESALGELQLGDVLSALAPGMANDIDQLAAENEQERTRKPT